MPVRLRSGSSVGVSASEMRRDERSFPSSQTGCAMDAIAGYRVRGGGFGRSGGSGLEVRAVRWQRASGRSVHRAWPSAHSDVPARTSASSRSRGTGIGTTRALGMSGSGGTRDRSAGSCISPAGWRHGVAWSGRQCRRGDRCDFVRRFCGPRRSYCRAWGGDRFIRGPSLHAHAARAFCIASPISRRMPLRRRVSVRSWATPFT
jgi:hypothetical protein